MLSVSNLSCVRADHTLFRGVGFDLARGGMVLFTSHQPVDIGGRSRSYRLGA